MRLGAIIALLVAICPLDAAQLQPTSEVENALSSEIDWQTNFEVAKEKSAAEKKPLFLYFSGSDWCPWCKEMESEILTTPAFKEALGQKMIFMKVDFPKKELLDHRILKQNEKLANDYNVQSFPTIVLLDSNLKVIDVLHFEGDGGAVFAQKVLKIIKTSNLRSPRN